MCTTQQRTAHRHALFVLSLPRFSGAGTAAQLAVLAEQHQRQVATLRDIVARTTGHPASDVAANLEAGRMLTAEEAMRYGLVDRIR